MIFHSFDVEIIQLCGAARNDTEQTENIKEIYVVKTKTRAAPSQQYDGAVILIIRISKYIQGHQL